jgi:hypothetical protein
MSDAEPLARYLADIRALPTIDRAALAALLPLARAGDAEAETQVLQGLLELTAVLTRHLAPPTMAPLDAVQEANVVLTALVRDPDGVSPVLALPPALQARFAGGGPVGT